MTKKGLIALSGRRFNRHDEGNCIEDIPLIRAAIKADAKANGCEYEEDDEKMGFGDRYLPKPLLRRNESVKVVFNPTSYHVYYCNGVMGDYMKKVTPLNNGFFVVADGKRITYTLEV